MRGERVQPGVAHRIAVVDVEAARRHFNRIGAGADARLHTHRFLQFNPISRRRVAANLQAPALQVAAAGVERIIRQLQRPGAASGQTIERRQPPRLLRLIDDVLDHSKGTNGQRRLIIQADVHRC
ncbi:MAG: hypothetical protein BWY63_03048 [Chloroflexi bacterium ADurb.Bin360]|nr:MAG: hypothetical protein BWY63_03048 [Chloroflexi bacterium ADurb.Bin360]